MYLAYTTGLNIPVAHGAIALQHDPPHYHPRMPKEHHHAHPHTRPDGRCVCLLDADEVARLKLLANQAEVEQPDSYDAWRDQFLRKLTVLGLDVGTVNAIARAMRSQPERFVGEDGERMTWAEWREAVVAGRWEAKGVERGRMKALVETLRR